jgi:hypothetical protein
MRCFHDSEALYPLYVPVEHHRMFLLLIEVHTPIPDCHLTHLYAREMNFAMTCFDVKPVLGLRADCIP